MGIDEPSMGMTDGRKNSIMADRPMNAPFLIADNLSELYSLQSYPIQG
jgi:hypothetical protein